MHTRFQYTREHVACGLCTEYRRRHGCTAFPCPWLAERIEAGAVGYEEALLESFPHDALLLARLQALVQIFPGSLWSGEDHRRRMEELKAQLGYRKHRDTPAYCAVMYLLTANRDLYARTANCFCRHGLEFDYAFLRGVSPHNYTLFSAARDIYTGAGGLSLNDLACRDVVDTPAFSLIINALLIARYGSAAFEIHNQRADKSAPDL